MDDQDRHDTMETLKTTREWTIWKTKDKEWSPTLQNTVFHQLLNIHKMIESVYYHAFLWSFSRDQMNESERI